LGNDIADCGKAWLLIMTSEFRKLLSREFGIREYNEYFVYVMRMFQNRHSGQNKRQQGILKEEMLMQSVVSKNMEIIMKQRTKLQLRQCSHDLLECMEMTMDINNLYFMVVIAFIGSIFVLAALSLTPGVFYTAVGALIISFLYKTAEFVVNKYCFVDAYLVLIYKHVLQKLLETEMS